MYHSRFSWKSILEVAIIIASFMIIPMMSLAPTWYKAGGVPADVLDAIQANNFLRSQQNTQLAEEEIQVLLDFEVIPIDMHPYRIPMEMVLAGIIIILLVSTLYIWKIYDSVQRILQRRKVSKIYE